jgi:hypothetical protein
MDMSTNCIKFLVYLVVFNLEYYYKLQDTLITLKSEFF